MFKRILSLCLVAVMAFGVSGCGSSSKSAETKLPEYAEKQFEISGFWAPYEISEESFKQYKDAGFTTLAMINHALSKTSENQFYLGSERTQKALELCKKVGLKAILNYNDWVATWSEDDENYYSDTPFSQYDIYGDYKDIITGVHICDEPSIDHIDVYGNKTLIEDFKKTYPNAKYIVNLIPMTALSSRKFDSYEQMMEMVEEAFMEPFEKPFISVDVYPFHLDMTTDDGTLLYNYKYIADSAKKYGVKPGYILQASVGGSDDDNKEFEMNLSESDLRWEIYNALLFGADDLQYYCYSVPKSFDDDDNVVGYMYDKCILNRDDTPSDIYYSLQKLHKEIQSFASVILSYDWDTTIGISGSDEQTYRVNSLEYDLELNEIKLENCKNYVSAKGTQDLAVSRFTSDKYGEAYMFLNWADRNDNTNKVTVEFKDCKSVALYGGADFDGTPEIIELDQDGKCTFELAYGEGKFVTPIA